MDPVSAVGREADFYAFLHRTTGNLRTAREADKVLRHYLRASAAFFGAEAACIAARTPAEDGARVVFSHPAEAEWDREFLADLIADRRPEFPRGLICSTLIRRGRVWGAIALRHTNSRFERWQERSIGAVAAEISSLIERIDRERLAEVRARIDGKLMRELTPKDLYYQILDGLHQLTRYDHSAALYILDTEAATLELVAEQIAWRKGKSQHIGRTLELGDEMKSLLGGALVYGFDRHETGWSEWTGLGAAGLVESLDRAVADDEPEEIPAPPIGAMLCAHLGAQRGPVGLMCLAALRPTTFGEYERDILAQFSTTVALVLQRSQALESLQGRMLLVERRNTLGQLARGVAHDINNALGAAMPLVQQLRTEVEDGTLDQATLREDLARIESSIEVSRRIFGGMLRFARGASRHDGICDLRRAVEVASDVLRGPLVRQGIRIELELPEALPSVHGGQEDVERLLLNLATNSREAMPRGGLLKIGVGLQEDWIRIRIEDTGRGIPEELVPLIDTPFFSTKSEGGGLGLPTCRSIVAEIGGELSIESEPDRGTRVTVLLRPVVLEPSPSA